MFNNIPETLLTSINFIHHEVDLPHHDLLVYTQYLTSYYKVASMMSIKLIGKSKKCFCYFYLIPDSKSLAEEQEHTAYDHEAKELLGKAKENLRRSTPPSQQAPPSTLAAKEEKKQFILSNGHKLPKNLAG